MARVATPAPSVSVPVAASPAATAAPAAAAAPRRLAVVVPVKVSVLEGAFATVLLVGHVQTAALGATFPGVQPLVQTAGLQVVAAVRENRDTDQQQGQEQVEVRSGTN